MGMATYEDVFSSTANPKHSITMNEVVKRMYSNPPTSPAGMKKEFQSLLADLNAQVTAINAIIARLP